MSLGLHSVFAIVAIQTQQLVALQMGTRAEAITIETFEAPRGEQTDLKAETKADVEPQIKKELPEKKVQKEETPVIVKKAEKQKKKAKVAKRKASKPMLATTLPEKIKVAEEPVPLIDDSFEHYAPLPEEAPSDLDSDLTQAENETPKYEEFESPEPEAPVVSAPETKKQYSSPISGGQDKRTEIPAFGTPGTLISESRLTEAGGNRPPSYPRDARKKGVQGKVEIRAYVDKEGKIEMPAIHKTSGSPVLDIAALDAFQKWRYRPGLTGWLIKPFSFRLTEN